MQLTLKTILNLKEKHQDFVYRDVRLNNGRIEVTVEPRKRSRAVCSDCGERCPGYDRLPQREFLHVPIWGVSVTLLYCARRVSCATCGVISEQVPWSVGKSPVTIAYAWFLSEWAKLLSVQPPRRAASWWRSATWRWPRARHVLPSAASTWVFSAAPPEWR